MKKSSNINVVSIVGNNFTRKIKRKSFLLILFVLNCITSAVDGTIRVISVNENETVYTIQERALILRSPDGLEGTLIISQPRNACSEVTSPPDTNGTIVNWILLATWGGLGDSCSLLNKIKNAEKAGYSAIIIQTTPGNDSDFIPVSDWYGIDIFPCLVTYDDGRVLGFNFTSEDFILKFEDEPINTWLGFFIASVLVILAILLAIGLSYVIVQMFVLILLWVRETIVHTIQQRRRNRRRRLPASQLKKLPILPWNTDIPQDTCTICLDNFNPEEKVRILPCSHVFHMVCIDPWLLKQRRKCPNCKGKIVFPDERCDSDSSTEDETTPLIRSRNSVERDNTLIFTFCDQDVARHQPMYTTIHRIFDEAANLPRPLDQQGPSRPNSTPVLVHASTSTRDATSKSSDQPSISATIINEEDPQSEPCSTSSRLMLKAKRLGKFVPKFGKSSSQSKEITEAEPQIYPVIEEASSENTSTTSIESVNNSDRQLREGDEKDLSECDSINATRSVLSDPDIETARREREAYISEKDLNIENRDHHDLVVKDTNVNVCSESEALSEDH